MQSSRNILQLLQSVTEYLETHGISLPRRTAQEVLSLALGMPRLNLYLEFDKPLTEPEQLRCQELLQRAASGEPIEYMAEMAPFYGLELKITPDVLIPRPETEILVDRVVQELRQHSLEGKTLVDICCGSGCIGLAIKKQFPQLHVILLDLCPKALAIASLNAGRLGLTVEVLPSDLVSALSDRKVDFAVCNPPYVSEREFECLPLSVRNFEPRKALLSGPTGLEFFDRLQSELPPIFSERGRLWLEMGSGQGKYLLNIFGQKPWTGVRCDRDWGGHDRFLTVELERHSRLS